MMGELGLFHDVAVVLYNLILCRMAVGRRQHHGGVRTAGLDIVHQLNHVVCALAGGAHDDADAILDVGDDLADVSLMLFQRHALILAGGAQQADALHAVFNQPVQMGLGLFKIEGAVLVERSDGYRVNSLKFRIHNRSLLID
jgi:hypothetical protein